MTILSIVGVLLGLAIIPFIARGLTMGRFLLIITLLLIHVGASIGYYLYSLSNPADALFYYHGDAYFRRVSWTGLNTALVGNIVQLLKHGLGATYLDCFMIFQAFGFWGLTILMRTFDEIHMKLRTPSTLLPMYILFLPSLHFWTSAIGKDSLTFLAVGLCAWAVIDFRKRLVYFGAGIVLMMLIRSHIALTILIALSFSTLLHREVDFGRKILLLVLALAGSSLLLGAVETTLNFDVRDASSVGDFFERRAAAEAADRGGMSISDAPYFVRLFSLLFRPLFFDTSSLFGYVTSVENMGSLLLFGFLVWHRSDVIFLARRVFFIRFVLVFTILMIMLLSMFNYNVGLGLRQRMMFIPALFSLFVAVWAMRESRSTAAQQSINTAVRAHAHRAASPTGY